MSLIALASLPLPWASAMGGGGSFPVDFLSTTTTPGFGTFSYLCFFKKKNNFVGGLFFVFSPRMSGRGKCSEIYCLAVLTSSVLKEINKIILSLLGIGAIL